MTALRTERLHVPMARPFAEFAALQDDERGAGECCAWCGRDLESPATLSWRALLAVVLTVALLVLVTGALVTPLLAIWGRP